MMAATPRLQDMTHSLRSLSHIVMWRLEKVCNRRTAACDVLICHLGKKKKNKRVRVSVAGELSQLGTTFQSCELGLTAVVDCIWH